MSTSIQRKQEVQGLPGPRDARGAHLVALLIGLVAFLMIFGPRFIVADAPFLQTPLGDVAAEMGGYFHFAHDGWRWPLFSLPAINQPEGANQLFIGGVPLMALVAKMIGKVTGNVPNFFGVWYLLCFILQTHSLFYLMRQITRERPYLLAFASLLGVLSYAFLTRVGHVSLFGQFLVIYAMALVIASTRRNAPAKVILLKMAVLVFAELFVFAYLAIDTIVLFGAVLVSLYFRGRLGFSQAVAIGAAFAIVLIAVAAGGGYFWAVGRADPVDISSYAALGLNLGSLVIPPRSVLFPNNALFNVWWEGNFYLGLGIVALWVLLLCTIPRPIGRIVVRNWPVTVIISALTLYCLSNHVDFGATPLWSYRLPGWMVPVVGMARSAGRLFWPIGYFLIAAAVALTVQKYRRFAVPLIVAVVAVACAEASQTYAFVQSKLFIVPSVSLNYTGLEQVMAQHKKLLLYPSFWCDPGADDSAKRLTHQQIEFVAARSNLASNSAITARKMKDCRQEAANVPAVGDGDLAIFLSPASARASFASHPQDVARQCRSFALGGSSGMMCSTSWTPQTTLPIPELTPPGELQAQLEVDGKIDFSIKGNSAGFIGEGWWVTPDEALTWTEGNTSTVAFRLPETASERLSLDIQLIAYVTPPKLPERMVEIFAGDEKIATWRFESSAWEIKRINFPVGLAGQAVTLTIKQGSSPSPKELGLSGDPRHLGLGVKDIILRSRQP